MAFKSFNEGRLEIVRVVFFFFSAPVMKFRRSDDGRRGNVFSDHPSRPPLILFGGESDGSLNGADAKH